MALIVVADSIKVAGRKEALELWGPPGVSPLRAGRCLTPASTSGASATVGPRNYLGHLDGNATAGSAIGIAGSWDRASGGVFARAVA